MEYYKFYPDGDVDPASRRTVVILQRKYVERVGYFWYFAGQREPLPEEYVASLIASVRENRAKIELLDEKLISKGKIPNGRALGELFNIY